MMKQGDAIALENKREYLCFDTAELDGKHYVFLISVEEPTDICFAEQVTENDETKIRIIGNREEKLKLAAILQEKAEANV